MIRVLWTVFLATVLFWPTTLCANSEDPTLWPERFGSQPPSPITMSLDAYPEIPEVMVVPTDPGQQFKFVSADRIFTPSNEVDAFFFSEPTTRLIQRLSQQIHEMGCESWWSSHVDSQPIDYPTLAESLEGAEQIVIGTVTGYRQGYSGSRPGTLLRLRIDDVVKGDVARLEKYVFFPVADFEAGPYRICIETDTFPTLPQLGDTLIVHRPAGPPPDLELWSLGAAAFITIRDDQVHLPKFFELPNKRLSSPEHLTSWIRNEFGETP